VARRPCLACGVPTEGARCAAHTLANPNREARKRIYDDPRHKRTREIVLERDRYTCVDCGHHDPSGRSLVCDHIHGVLEIADPFDSNECAARCLICSGRKDGARAHRGEGGRRETWACTDPWLGRSGRKLVR
jgi:hypothetical protein